MTYRAFVVNKPRPEPLPSRARILKGDAGKHVSRPDDAVVARVEVELDHVSRPRTGDVGDELAPILADRDD